jgi:hypothetical protein
MDIIISHLPHILAPLVGVAFLVRLALYLKRLPPSHLNDEELAAWHAEHRKGSPSRS